MHVLGYDIGGTVHHVAVEVDQAVVAKAKAMGVNLEASLKAAMDKVMAEVHPEMEVEGVWSNVVHGVESVVGKVKSLLHLG